MFVPIPLSAILLFILAGQTIAFPLPVELTLETRMAESFQAIPAYVRRQIPAEVATKSPIGTVERYAKREEVPSKSPDGTLKINKKRQIPAEIATKSPTGTIERY